MSKFIGKSVTTVSLSKCSQVREVSYWMSLLETSVEPKEANACIKLNGFWVSTDLLTKLGSIVGV